MPKRPMQNRNLYGMRFRGFLRLIALVLGFSLVSPVGLGLAVAQGSQTPQQGSLEWLTQYYQQNKDWFASKGKELNDFVGAYSDCQMSGASDCSVELVKERMAAGYLQQAMGYVGGKVREVVMRLNSTCWACDTYVAIFGGLIGLAGETFSYFVETRSIVGLAVVVLSIILVIKVFLIISAPAAQDFNHAYGDVFKYMGRVAIVFLVFLTPLTATALKSNDSDHPVKVLFVDGPLMLGTEIGRLLVEETSAITKAKLQNQNCSLPPNMSDFAQQHLRTACNLLWSFHSMGVAGIASGTWLMFEAPVSMDNPSVGALISVILAGFMMSIAFLWFTITFGLRYLDALIRAGLTLALLPIFLFLWSIGTNSMKGIAHAGLRSILYMGAVFAASGFVFVICNEIMNFGFAKALGSSVTSNASQAFLSAMGQGGFNWFVGSGGGGSGGEANWMSFFYLMGAWGLATKAASIVFQLAEELVDFRGGQTGAGKEAEVDLKDKAGTGLSWAGGGAKMVGSSALRMMR